MQLEMNGQHKINGDSLPISQFKVVIDISYIMVMGCPCKDVIIKVCVYTCVCVLFVVGGGG